MPAKMATLSDAANAKAIRRTFPQMKLVLAIAVLSCIAQTAAPASRSDTTAAEAIILYKGGDRDLMVYFLGLGEGMAWANIFAIHKSQAALLRAARIDERSII